MGQGEAAGVTDVTVWGREIERRHAWLLHTASLAVGPVERFFTGAEGDRYTSAIDGQLVAAPVLLLGTGHALLAKPESFVEIGPDEAVVYTTTIEKLRNTIVDAVKEAAVVLQQRQHAPELPMTLVISAVRAQLHALEATATTMAPPSLVEPIPATEPSGVPR